MRELRIQLTFWFVGLVMLVYLVDGICGVFMIDYRMKSEIYADLARQCLEIAPAVETVKGKPTLSSWAAMERHLHLKPDATVQVFDRDKKVLEVYGNPGVPILQHGLLGKKTYSSYIPLDSGYLQVQIPTTERDEAIHDFGISKVVRGFFIALAIGVCGWIYSGKAIEPVARSIATLRTFVADAGHELRTPVTLIENSLETLEADLLDHNISTEVLPIMMRASSRLKNLANNLLLLAKMENPELELRKAPVDAKELIGNVVLELTEAARDRKVALETVDIPPATVFGDRDSLSRVFSNLIENAIRYTPAGGCISVGGWKQDTAVCLYIEDTGIGIPPESLPNIFDRFYRVDKARTREAGGSGLGLAIVKAIVDAHGGDVTVESHVGRGSKFTVLLPLAATARAAVNVG